VRPPAFDLAAYWQQSSADFVANLPRYPATLRADAAILPRMRRAGHFARIEQVGPPDADGWLTVSMRFEVEEEACEYVLSFGPQIEVLEPPALREKIIHLAQRVVAFYAQRACAPPTGPGAPDQA
jgi:predicted DNA-binding transcriptional regulator YafY